MKQEIQMSKILECHKQAASEETFKANIKLNLVHPPDELIYVILTVSSISSFNIVIPLLLEATQRCLELEGPEEIVSLLEVRPNGHDLMDKIFNADDSEFPECLTPSKNIQLLSKV